MYYIIILFSLMACSANKSATHSIDKVREAAWNYIEENGWDQQIKEEWQKATVKKMIADYRYKNFEGKEILIVILENSINSPIILVDPETNQVLGHIPGE